MHRLAHAGTLALPGGVRRRATHQCAAWRSTAEIGSTWIGASTQTRSGGLLPCQRNSGSGGECAQCNLTNAQALDWVKYTDPTARPRSAATRMTDRTSVCSGSGLRLRHYSSSRSAGSPCMWQPLYKHCTNKQHCTGHSTSTTTQTSGSPAPHLLGSPAA